MRKTILLMTLASMHVSAFSQAITSVLATGNWYQIAVIDEGIYKITYSDLLLLGVPASSIDPRDIRVYGNGGGMLPGQNNIPRPDDLNEIAIKVIGESDGVFDVADYILFYGQSQPRWKYDSLTQGFYHVLNSYCDTTYYFLTADLGSGKRIASLPSSSQSATDTMITFDDIQFHELDSINFLHRGREWYGEQFDSINTSRAFQFSVPDIDTNSPVTIKTQVLGRSFTSVSQFQLTSPGGVTVVGITSTTSSATADYAKIGEDTVQFITPSSTIPLTSKDFFVQIIQSS